MRLHNPWDTPFGQLDAVVGPLQRDRQDLFDGRAGIARLAADALKRHVPADHRKAAARRDKTPDAFQRVRPRPGIDHRRCGQHKRIASNVAANDHVILR